MCAIMRVTEIFHSLQGEGRLAGVPSVFVRLAGCPLRCTWCDTKYAWDENSGDEYDVTQIMAAIEKWQCRHVVITGGEPMIHKDLPQLCKMLKQAGKQITIETAGIIASSELPCDLMSISPKLSNSEPDSPELAKTHNAVSLNLPMIQKLIKTYDYQFKFVVDCEQDIDEIIDTLRAIGDVDPVKVMLMPQARDREELLAKSLMVAELCKKTGFTFCQRLHILLWDGRAGA